MYINIRTSMYKWISTQRNAKEMSAVVLADREGVAAWLTCWEMEQMKWRQKNFVRGRLEQSRQDKNLLYRHDEPNEPTKEGPFRTPWVPICLSINSHQGPPLSSLSGGAHSNDSKKHCLLFTYFCSMVPSYLNHIEEPAHDDSTEEVLEGNEGVRDAQQQGGQL